MIECVAIKSVAFENAAIENPRDLLGSVAISKRGRDKDRPCVILGWLPDDFALIADGKRRTVAKPKKKNMKHLIFTKCCPGDLKTRFLTGEQVTDRMIREGLAAYGGRIGEGRHG